MVCKSLPWRYKGGIQSHTWDLSRSLAELGHDVCILTAGSIRTGFKSYTKNSVTILELPYIPGRYLKPLARLAEEFFFNLSARIWMKKNEQAYDVIHLQGRSGFLYAMDAANCPIISTIHGLNKHENHSNKKGIANYLYNTITAYFELRSTRYSSKLISVSQDLKANLLEEGIGTSSMIHVIQNGVENIPLAEEASKRNKGTKLVFVGRLEKVKGLDMLVKIMAQVHNQITLDIIGDGPMKTELEDLIKTNDLQDRITLLGELPRDEVYKHLKSSMALLLTSTHETQGIVLLEANLNGIPVVASKLDAIKESIKDGKNGLLCAPLDVSHFVKSIHYLFDHPVEAKMMGQYGRDLVRAKFNWEQIAEKTIEVYQEVLTA